MINIDWKLVLVGVGALIFLGGGVAIGQWMEKDTVEELTRRTNKLAERDRVRAQKLDDMHTAYRKLTLDFLGENELREELARRHELLADSLSKERATVTRLAQANSTLRETLEGMDPVAETDSTYIVEIDKRNVYERGEVSVQGQVTINKARPDSARTELDVGVRTNPLLVWQRNDDGTSEIVLDYGDMPITVDSIYGASNLDDPIHEDTRGPLFGGTSGFLMGVLTGIATLSTALAVF